jgi:hypothetical protein
MVDFPVFSVFLSIVKLLYFSPLSQQISALFLLDNYQKALVIPVEM